MNETRVLNITSDLCGRQVRVSGSFERAGVVTDVLVHTTEGRILGLVLRTRTGAERRLAADRLTIGEQLVVSTENLLDNTNVDCLAHGVAARGELLDAEVVTDDGQLLGRVAEVRVSLPDGKVFYKVAPSGISKFFAETFHLPGDLPHAYSASGKRLFLHGGKADEVRAARIADLAPSALWQYAGFPETTRAFVSRHGVTLWFMLTVVLLSSMLYL